VRTAPTWASVPILTGLLVILPRLAHAVPNTALRYSASASCPSQEDFVAAVASRGGRFDDEQNQSSPRVMVIAITEQQGGGYTGTFRVREAQGDSGARDIHGASCSEVVDALAVVTAIALRPQQEGVPNTVSPARPEPPPQPAAATPPTPPEAASPKRFRGHTQWPNATLPVTPGTLHFNSRKSISLNAGASIGPFRSLLLPRLDLSYHALAFVTTPDGTQRIVGPIMRMHFSLLGGATLHSGDMSTQVSGQAVALGMCATPYYDSRGLVLLGCAEFGGGLMALDTKNSSGTKVQSKLQGFGKIGLLVEAEYNLGSWFHMGLTLGAEQSTVSFTAERADGSQIFESGKFSGYGLFGIGGHF
jgi:hypothetical protein